MKTEGQVQDVWRLRDIIHRKESNTWGDEGFGDQMEKTVQFGQVTFDASLVHLKEIMFNRQLAVHKNYGITPFGSHHNLRRKETEAQRCQVTYLVKVTYLGRGRDNFIPRNFGSRAHIRNLKPRREKSWAWRCDWKVIHTWIEVH